jgi:hypothetical protein
MIKNFLQSTEISPFSRSSCALSASSIKFFSAAILPYLKLLNSLITCINHISKKFSPKNQDHRRHSEATGTINEIFETGGIQVDSKRLIKNSVVERREVIRIMKRRNLGEGTKVLYEDNVFGTICEFEIDRIAHSVTEYLGINRRYHG